MSHGEGASLRDRAGRPPDQAPAGLGDAATIPSAALLELAERCEKAAASDRELDVDIALLVGGAGKIGGTIYHQGADAKYTLTHGMTLAEAVGKAPKRDCAIWNAVPDFTASVDAAMTLVPERFDWIIGHTNSGLTIHAEVGGRGGEYQRFAATPALALCAAALRARAA
jgi:hypothetical protein